MHKPHKPKDMKEKKLSTEQNLALQGLSLQEKLNLLYDWKKKGEINQQQFNYFSNRWITREGKKAMEVPNVLRRDPYENRVTGRTVIEIEMEQFLNQLQGKLNQYLIQRTPMPLTIEEKRAYARYLSQYGYLKPLVNQLLVLGLKYPDKELNTLAEAQIKAKKKDSILTDNYFWCLLWADNLVPMDAVRLMLKKNNVYEIDDCFSKELVKELLPLMVQQRDKELVRLKWAQSLEGKEREREVARKSKRAASFNILIDAAERFVNG